MDDKTALKTSSAGMRLIAQTTLFNQGDFPRLKQYVSDNYHPAALEEISVSTWVAEMKAVYRLHGKLRVKQVLATDKHKVIAVMESEGGGHFMVEMTVEEEYPHKILGYQLQPMEVGQ